MKFDSFHTLLAVAAAQDLEIHQLDVKNAYLAGKLEEEDLYMEIPEGLHTQGKICKLVKGLYGLKQAGRVWNKEISGMLNKMGFY